MYQKKEDIEKYYKALSKKANGKYGGWGYCYLFIEEHKLGCNDCFFSQLNRRVKENCCDNRKFLIRFLLKKFPDLLFNEEKK